MVNQYIERKLLRKNLGVYFKKGKWILHVLFLSGLWGAITIQLSEDNIHIFNSEREGLGSFLRLIPFIAFFYTYCLYLIPYCFKRNQFKKFWILLILLLVVAPIIDIGWQYTIASWIPSIAASLKKSTLPHQLKETYKLFFSNFAGFSSMLFLMELLEGVRTSKDTHDNSTQLLATEKQLIKTRMDPKFINQSLDGIIRLTSAKDDAAPDSVIRFSDVLRYRLYRSAERYVLLDEELQQLGNLIRFHNAIHEADAFCTLETEGLTEKKHLPPLSLINITEPLLNLYAPGIGWSLLIYILVEENELQAAVELSADHPHLSATFDTIEKNLQSIFGDKAIFSVETEATANSVRICIPILNNLIAS